MKNQSITKKQKICQHIYISALAGCALINDSLLVSLRLIAQANLPIHWFIQTKSSGVFEPGFHAKQL
jgi:hypothetical protein